MIRFLTGALLGTALLASLPALGQQSAQNEANNPLTPKITLNFQNYYDTSLYGVPDRDANQFLLRGLIPHDAFGEPQLLRYTVPIQTAPTFPTGYDTGLGDITLNDLFMIPGKGVEFGVGPLLAMPTGTRQSSGKWQAGAMGLGVMPQSWGMIVGLVTFQQSFAGPSNRTDVSLMTVQPIVLYNLPDGYYLRSSGIYDFDLHDGSYSIPLGFGAGKVFQLNETTTANMFIEPQYTVAHQGAGAPMWAVFAGLNLQLAMGH